MTTKDKTAGLAGIIAGDSEICLCNVGEQGEHALAYRGYSINDLAAHASFEEVAWLLTRGYLPSKQELKGYQLQLKKNRELPASLKTVLELIPEGSNVMDVMRTGCSFLGNIEPETEQHDQLAVADRLIGSFSGLFLYWYFFHKYRRPFSLTTNEETLAGHILHLITGHSPSPLQKQALNAELILYAEHDFNASTFTTRVIASTLSDFYSAICGGLGALRGPLHGGANEAAMELIQQFRNPEDAANGILNMLNQKQLVMGFGHRVYRTSDPRSAIAEEFAYKLSLQSKDPHLFDIAKRIEEVMWQEKKLFPNLDFYSALVFHYLNIPVPMFTPLFAVSRITGWSAHLMEQRAHNRLIRPLSHYTGPSPCAWVPLEKRT